MRDVELLTPLPIGPGTLPRALGGGAGTEMLVEIVEFDRPNRLGSRTTSSMMTTSGFLTFTPAGDGTLMAWDWEVQPRGAAGLGPLFGPMGARMERGIWTGAEAPARGRPGRPLLCEPARAAMVGVSVTTR